MDLGLKGMVALVTAGSKGLGRASALSLASNHAKVCITARGQRDLDAAVAMIQNSTGRKEDVFGIQGDVTQQDDLSRIFKAVLSKWGQCDILVANCGGPKVGTFQQLKPEDWDVGVQQTMMSFVRACYTVIPHMTQRKSGSIVTIQSYTVKQGLDNLVLSNSIRLANLGLVRSLATELGPLGIRVNSINPGLHITDRLRSTFEAKALVVKMPVAQVIEEAAQSIPLRRINTAENFGQNVAWLASPAASYITGQAIIVDGGVVRSPL